MTWLNIGCGTHNAPAPWVNVDCVEKPDVHPDVIAPVGEPLPFPDGSAEKVFAGHVLEHVPWPETLAFVHDLKRILAAGGELLVVGPDVLRTIERYKLNLEPVWMVHTVLEYHDRNPGFETSDWPQARHWWNCWEARVVDLLEQCGFASVEALPPPEGVEWETPMPPWPIVGAAPWQCFVLARV